MFTSFCENTSTFQAKHNVRIPFDAPLLSVDRSAKRNPIHPKSSREVIEIFSPIILVRRTS